MSIEDLVDNPEMLMKQLFETISQPGGFSRLASKSISFFLSHGVPIYEVIEESCRLSTDGNFPRYFFKSIKKYDSSLLKVVRNESYEKKLAYHLVVTTFIGTSYLVEREKHGDFFRFLESYKGKAWVQKK